MDGGDGQMVHYLDFNNGSVISIAMIVGKGMRTMLKIKDIIIIIIILVI